MKLLSKILMSLLAFASAVAPAAVAQRLYAMTGKTTRTRLAPADSAVLDTAKVHALEWAPGKSVTVYEFGDGPLAILQHGWNGGAAQFLPLVELLRSLNYKVLVLDAPAHGRSSGSESDLLEMTTALEFVSRRQPEIALLVGHSVGCLAVAHGVARGIGARQVVLISPPASVTALMIRQLKKIPVSKACQERVLQLSTARLGVDAWNRLDFARLAPLFPAHVQVHVIHDKDDREVPLSDGQLVADAFGSAQLTMTEQLGHRKILRAKAVLATVAAFVQPAPAALGASGAAG